ncbi:hypothetical protein KCTC32516_00409 [Polaribacter huanghezhanensis]|uniref:hypothetical protein n=1 Tax=Polaribacter huanghezhanensis TaxID=1354726 RepID=UPI002649FBFD|nr:hypothetical protein [Polaribacter huanghezhanensis]WKD85071.1 hypothetical protein KCTC32516_00409 [Polaribacter huanghezhanensis]
MKKLSLNKFRIMNLNSLSKIKGGYETDGGETVTDDAMKCVSGSARDVPAEQTVNYPTTQCV